MLYEKILQKEPENFQALLTAAFLHLRIGWLYSSKDKKKEHYFKLYDYAKRAQALNPLDYQTRLLAIVAKAKITEYLSTGEQVRMIRELYQELDSIIAIRSDDPDSIYILSWLNFKVGRVSPLERFMAALFFGELPDYLTVQNAILLMEKVIAMRPEYSVYYYDLGLFMQREAHIEKARELFQKVLSLKPQKPEDHIYIQKAQKQLQNLTAHVSSNG